MRALTSGSRTLKRRRSAGKKEGKDEAAQEEEKNTVTAEPIKEETGEMLQDTTRGASMNTKSGALEKSGKESEEPEQKPMGEGGSEHETETTTPELSKGKKKEEKLLVSKQERKLESPAPKKEKRKDKKGSKQAEESRTQEVPIGVQQLREAPLWKLPNLEHVKLRRHSTGGVTHEITPPVPFAPSYPPIVSDSKSGSQPDLPSLPAMTHFRPLPEIPPDLPASLPELPIPSESPNAKTDSLSTPASARVSHGSLTNSTDLSSTPAKERKTSQASQSSSSQEQRYTPPQDDGSQSVEAVTIPESLSIGQMVEVFSKSFPLRIKVLQGYCSENSQVNISTNDVYTVHFVKHTKIVRIKDEDGDNFSIPLGSGVKIGLIYKPHHDLDEALSGLQFEKVSDLLAMPSLPKVVCVTKAYQSSDDKVTLEENELLAVRQVHKSMFKGKKGLKVYSLLTLSEKLLPEDCTGQFSTKPSLVRLHLPEIIEYLQNPFPSHAVMYLSVNSAAQIPGLPGTTSRVVMVSESSIETSLVVSFSSEDEDKEGEKGEGDGEEGGEEGMEKQRLFDIPLDDEIVEVEVKILESKEDDEDDEEHVYDDTVALLRDWDLSQFQPPDEPSTPPQGEDGDGGRDSPEYMNLTRQPPPERELPPTPCNDEDEEKDEDPYDTVLHYRRDDSSETAYDRVGYDRIRHADPTMSCWMEDLQSATSTLEQRLRSIEKSQQSADLNV